MSEELTREERKQDVIDALTVLEFAYVLGAVATQDDRFKQLLADSAAAMKKIREDVEML